MRLPRQVMGNAEAARAGSRLVRIWDQTRTSHFELLKNMEPGLLVFRRKSYDFHDDAAANLEVEQKSILQTCRLLARSEFQTVELNEPTMVRCWPQLIVYLATIRTRGVLVGHRPAVVAYAIENVDLVKTVARKVRLPVRVVAPVVTFAMRLLLGQYDRLVFGTSGARRTYAPFLGRTGPDNIQVDQLPAACECLRGAGALEREKVATHVLFVGAFERRKGVPELMKAWERLERSAAHEYSLELIGRGGLAREIGEWARGRAAVTVKVDPPREQIHEAYRRARVVVLLSSERFGREQVGLPIVEGLAHGCHIVTTEQTGIADLLTKLGHTVVTDISAELVSGAIESAISGGLSTNQVLDRLPTEHARLVADRWLMFGSEA